MQISSNNEFDVSVHTLAQAMEDDESRLIILDVRQPWELRLASLSDDRVVALPMAVIAGRALDVLPSPSPNHPTIFVLCHHGLRSATVVRWLRQQGWTNSYNIRGGIDAYQRHIDPAVGRY